MDDLYAVAVHPKPGSESEGQRGTELVNTAIASRSVCAKAERVLGLTPRTTLCLTGLNSMLKPKSARRSLSRRPSAPRLKVSLSITFARVALETALFADKALGWPSACQQETHSISVDGCVVHRANGGVGSLLGQHEAVWVVPRTRSPHENLPHACMRAQEIQSAPRTWVRAQRPSSLCMHAVQAAPSSACLGT